MNNFEEDIQLLDPEVRALFKKLAVIVNDNRDLISKVNVSELAVMHRIFMDAYFNDDFDTTIKLLEEDSYAF